MTPPPAAPKPLEGDALVVHAPRTPTPLISVVLPTYNRVQRLKGSIESVLAQTVADFELIIVDDGSADGTAELVDQFAARDPRVCLVQQKNLKLPKALNNGFRLARGALRTWTSDDNRYFPDAFELLSKALTADPNLALVHGEMLARTEQGALYTPTPDPADFWRFNKVGAAFMYRTRHAEQVGEYDTQLFMAEDYDYWLRLSKVGGVKHLPFIIYEYAHHAGSLTNSRRLAHIQALENLARKHLSLRTTSPRQIGRLVSTVSGNYRRYGYHREAWLAALFACRCAPLSPLPWKSLLLSLAARLLFRSPDAERRLRETMGRGLP